MSTPMFAEPTKEGWTPEEIRAELAGQIEWCQTLVREAAREAGQARAAWAAAEEASNTYAAKISPDPRKLKMLRKARNDARRLLDERLYLLGDLLEGHRKAVLDYTESF